MLGFPFDSSSTIDPRHQEATSTSSSASAAAVTAASSAQSSGCHPSYVPSSPVQNSPSRRRGQLLPAEDPRSTSNMRDDMVSPYPFPTSHNPYFPGKMVHQDTPSYAWSSQQPLPLQSPAIIAAATEAAEQPFSNSQPILFAGLPARYHDDSNSNSNNGSNNNNSSSSSSNNNNNGNLQSSSYLQSYPPAGLPQQYIPAHSPSSSQPYQVRRSTIAHMPSCSVPSSPPTLSDQQFMHSSQQVSMSTNLPNVNNPCLPSPETLYSSPESTPLSLPPPLPPHHSPAESERHSPPSGRIGAGGPGVTGVTGTGEVINSTRPRPQCWEHGCNGREFSTFSNLLRHQRERSGVITKAECPVCGAVFTRTTARNIHVAQGKCKGGSTTTNG